MTDSKLQILKTQGALNAHPELVRDTLFITNDFFDPNDLVQVRYEMLRKVRVDGLSPAQAAQTFGFSRQSYYNLLGQFEDRSLPGLMPRRRGPKGAHKLSSEVVAYLEESCEGDRRASPMELAKAVRGQFGIQVHPRSIQRVLAQKKRL